MAPVAWAFVRPKSVSIVIPAGNMSEVEQSVRGGQQGMDVSRPNGSKTKRILLVEEEPLLRVAILNNLRRVGFAVDVASNGTIALEKLRSSAPDAIFLDLMLPDIDSVEVISEARRQPEYADLPIYVYTSAFPMKSRRAAKAGATQIFDKISTPLDEVAAEVALQLIGDRKSTRLNSSHGYISYAVFCLKKKKKLEQPQAGLPNEIIVRCL